MKTKITKKLAAIALVGMASTQIAIAQTEKTTRSVDSGKNLFKINLPSLVMKTFHFQYERAISKKISVGLGYRYMAKGALPFSSSLTNIDNQLGGLTLGNNAITPEIKFYFGKGVFKGFYIAPFARFATYKAAIDYEFEVNNSNQIIPLSGTLKTVTGGVLFGAQWRIAKKVYLDWSMLGPQFGRSNGQLTGKRALSAQEQQELRDKLNNIDLPIGKTTATVNANGATLNFDGPWAGIRANIGIGYRF